MSYWLGVDPGKKGSYTVIDNNNNIILQDKMPIIKLDKPEIDIYTLSKTLTDLFLKYPSLKCCLEKSTAMPGQGVTSMFSFGKAYGIVLTILTVSAIPFFEVHPRSWTKLLYEGISGTGKERAYNVARKLFPCWKPTFKYERDWADSLLIAEYCRRKTG